MSYILARRVALFSVFFHRFRLDHPDLEGENKILRCGDCLPFSRVGCDFIDCLNKADEVQSGAHIALLLV